VLIRIARLNFRKEMGFDWQSGLGMGRGGESGD
jgi:hypothetical protein